MTTIDLERTCAVDNDGVPIRDPRTLAEVVEFN